MFSAFAKGFPRGQIDAKQARDEGVQWIAGHVQDFEDFVSGHLQTYLLDMSLQGTWGDNLILQAMCDRYQVDVMVLKERTDGTKSWNRIFHRGQGQSICVMWLYLSDNHYETLVLRE
jgi:hypothetical protein